MNEEAQQMVDAIKSIVNQMMNKVDRVVVCEIAGINDDGTYDVYVGSDILDKRSAVTNRINQTKFDFEVGDMAYLYVVQNQIINSFIIAKIF